MAWCTPAHDGAGPVAREPGCFGLLAAGEISEHTAALLVSETSHLDPEVRRVVDAQLVAERVEQMAPEQRRARPAGWPRPLTRPAV